MKVAHSDRLFTWSGDNGRPESALTGEDIDTITKFENGNTHDFSTATSIEQGFLTFDLACATVSAGLVAAITLEAPPVAAVAGLAAVGAAGVTAWSVEKLCSRPEEIRAAVLNTRTSLISVTDQKVQ